MQEVVKIIVGIAVLVLGVFVGDFLARITKEELKGGQIWFKIIITVGIVCSVISLIMGNDYLLFSFLFISIVTSRSLR